MASREWIVVTDSNDYAVRVQVRHIHYFRGNNVGGTTICLGGEGDGRFLLSVSEDTATIDDLIGGELEQ